MYLLYFLLFHFSPFFPNQQIIFYVKNILILEDKKLTISIFRRKHLLNENINLDNQLNLDTAKQKKSKLVQKLVLFILLTFIWSWSWFLPSILDSYEIIEIPPWLGDIFNGLALFGSFIIIRLPNSTASQNLSCFEMVSSRPLYASTLLLSYQIASW